MANSRHVEIVFRLELINRLSDLSVILYEVVEGH